MKHIIVKDVKEFADLFLPSERPELSKAVIDVIEENIGNSNEVVKDIKVTITDNNTDIILSIIRTEFLSVLEEQLELFEEIEDYRECARIFKLISKIKSGSIVQSLVDTHNIT